jgi:hypothetical protein
LIVGHGAASSDKTAPGKGKQIVDDRHAPLKLAVLGLDPDLCSLLSAAGALGHKVVWLGDVASAEMPRLQGLVPAGMSPSDDWETLLDRAAADAVLVGRGGNGPAPAGDLIRASREEQLRRLAAEAVPMLIVQPAHLSVLNYYELDMLRRETGGILRHFHPLMDDPFVGELARWVRQGHAAIGRIVQVACSRHAADGSRETVFGHLARDAELLAAIAGDIRTVSAVGPRVDAGSRGASYASLQVQMVAALPATLRWSVVPADRAGTAMELQLVGEQGTLCCRSMQDGAWQLAADGLAPAAEMRPADKQFDAARAALRALAIAVRESDRERRSKLSTWDKATRAMEVVDAVEMSLQKGRTIEVFQQQLTERLAFRGVMSAVGCGVLMLGLLVTFVVSLVGGLESVVKEPLVPAWSTILLIVLALFLLLQAVPLLLSRRQRKQGDGTSPGRSAD